MTNTFTCEYPECDKGSFTDHASARRHRYTGTTRCFPSPSRTIPLVSQVENKYACPLPECGKDFRRREGIQEHVIRDHNDEVALKVFDTPASGSSVHRGSGDASAQVLVPATPPADCMLASVDISPPGGSAMVSLLPSVDYLRSHESLDALGVCMHTALKILFCYSCPAALTFGMVAGHRKTNHKSHQVRSSSLQPFVLE
ncbi:hypothetical protein DFH29DRAFT_1007785 [Suillus ampliporus]|nr:hypothetical protein DFH29DRAFT_1007785 [Suillus ampliporus]